MLLNSLPQILTWKTGWWNFTLLVRDKQAQGIGVAGISSLVCWHSCSRCALFLLAFPLFSCLLWLGAAPACSGKVGLDRLYLSLGLMAQHSRMLLGCTWKLGSPQWALHPIYGPASPPAFTASEAVRLVLWAHPPSPQHHTAFPGSRAVSQASIWFHWHCT